MRQPLMRDDDGSLHSADEVSSGLALAAASGPLVTASIVGEVHPRVTVNADGTISWTDGGNVSQVELALDDVNRGNNAIGVFPLGNASGSTFTVYHGVAPDGSVTDADGNTQALIRTATGFATVSVSCSDGSQVGFASLSFSPDSGGSVNIGGPIFGQAVALQCPAANVVEVQGNGAGIRLTSPDGTKTKTITIDNTGAVALL